MEPTRLLIVLAGPNGAGKSTFHERYLRLLGLPFVNADVIAATLPGPDDEAKARRAAALAEEARQAFLAAGTSFITETVLSDPAGDKVAKFAAARSMGFVIEVHFVGIASPALSQARVMTRVAAGGHDVPDDRIAARYPRVLMNLTRLLDVADRLFIYDNSEVSRSHRLVAALEAGLLTAVADPLPAWLASIPLAARRHSSTRLL